MWQRRLQRRVGRHHHELLPSLQWRHLQYGYGFSSNRPNDDRELYGGDLVRTRWRWQPPVANLDDIQAVLGEPIDIDVLLNDYTNDCSEPTIIDYDTVSAYGGTIELIGGESGVLRYTPPAEPLSLDGFIYGIIDDSGQEDRVGVLVHFIMPRPADSPTSVAPGTTVQYYSLDALNALPDFGALTPISSEVLTDINLASTNGVFAGSGLSDNVGAVFEGLIEVPIATSYTLYVESDDGSRLFIGDEMVVDNDGLHGMQEEPARFCLQQGFIECVSSSLNVVEAPV